MATYRPRVLAQKGATISGRAVKDGYVLIEGVGWFGITKAPDGPFVASDWPYQVFSPDPNSGVTVLAEGLAS